MEGQKLEPRRTRRREINRRRRGPQFYCFEAVLRITAQKDAGVRLACDEGVAGKNFRRISKETTQFEEGKVTVCSLLS